jgi:hypothetical protein
MSVTIQVEFIASATARDTSRCANTMRMGELRDFQFHPVLLPGCRATHGCFRPFVARGIER